MSSTSTTGPPDSSSNQPGTSGPGSGSRKRQRDTSPPTTSTPKRQRGPMPPTTKKDQYHLTKKEVAPEDKPLQVRDCSLFFVLCRCPNQIIAHIQNGFNIHLRLLWGLTKATDAPPTPSKELLNDFERRFGPATRLAGLKNELKKVPSHQDAVEMARALRTRVSLQRSTIATNIGRVKDSFLGKTFSIVLAAGLKKWCPDILGSPDSLYNQVHQQVAVQSFKVAAAGFGYAHMNIDLTKAQNDSLLDEFYESFVWSYMADLAKTELRNAGGVAKAIAATNAYKRRQQVRH
ncbi:hypothetical protein B0H10DRAFT_1793293 [Mycena sp. CBHHK59/15]|nr:hypothetical protein B0H10DRAFT_1812211 [Mycena sp. CBHHK59/15]KAJ6619494.1 hypothetical protein B0H10DRAFT_1793293 [Mycena sp. CBHHK59/15]